MIYQEFLKYRDEDGLNQLHTDGVKGLPSQNGTLFTMQYLLCLLHSGAEQGLIIHEIERIGGVYQRLEQHSGLSRRSMNSTECTSMDNEAALLTFSALFGSSNYAKRVLEHGETTYAKGVDITNEGQKNADLYPIAYILGLGKPRYFWNCNDPDRWCLAGWFGRSPAFLGLLKMTTGRFCNPFLWLAVLVGQFLGCTSPASNTDARTLAYIIWQYLNTRSFIWRALYKVWCWQLMKVYPEGIKSVYEHYYQDKNHPIIKYSKSF